MKHHSVLIKFTSLILLVIAQVTSAQADEITGESLRLSALAFNDYSSSISVNYQASPFNIDPVARFHQTLGQHSPFNHQSFAHQNELYKVDWNAQVNTQLSPNSNYALAVSADQISGDIGVSGVYRTHIKINNQKLDLNVAFSSQSNQQSLALRAFKPIGSFNINAEYLQANSPSSHQVRCSYVQATYGLNSRGLNSRGLNSHPFNFSPPPIELTAAYSSVHVSYDGARNPDLMIDNVLLALNLNLSQKSKLSLHYLRSNTSYEEIPRESFGLKYSYQL